MDRPTDGPTDRPTDTLILLWRCKDAFRLKRTRRRRGRRVRTERRTRRGKKGKRRFFFSTTTTAGNLEKWDGAKDQNCSDYYEIFHSFIYMYFQIYPNPGT